MPACIRAIGSILNVVVMGENRIGMFQTIIALMRPHDTYVEPFAGSAAILARKAPAARSIVLDKDVDVVLALLAGPLAEIPGVGIRESDALDFLCRLDPAGLGRVRAAETGCGGVGRRRFRLQSPASTVDASDCWRSPRWQDLADGSVLRRPRAAGTKKRPEAEAPGRPM